MSAAPMPRIAHRLFFALKPDEITARRTHVFAEMELGSEGLLRPERHHVTLAITNDMPAVPAALVEALLRAGEAVRAAPFELVLDRLSGGVGTVALRPSRTLPPLREMQVRIAAAMAAEGVAMRENWQFSPHETLCYRKGMTPFSRQVPGFHWPVSEFVLIHSFVGLHRHDVLGQWRLRAPDDPQGRLL